MKHLPHLALYAMMWVALALGFRQYLAARGKAAIPAAYWVLLGLLAVLQLYGEAWRR